VFLRALTLYLDPACVFHPIFTLYRMLIPLSFPAMPLVLVLLLLRRAHVQRLRRGHRHPTRSVHYLFPGLHALRLRCGHDAPSLRTRCCILPASSVSVLCTIGSFLAGRAESSSLCRPRRRRPGRQVIRSRGRAARVPRTRTILQSRSCTLIPSALHLRDASPHPHRRFHGLLKARERLESSIGPSTLSASPAKRHAIEGALLGFEALSPPAPPTSRFVPVPPHLQYE
jgi:hypothetical protein